ncbi:unnamed protein product [Symbiodinium sp. CCMP2592]|nr:unnamed protein product [Symbiodinium sp. CCMP2592]
MSLIRRFRCSRAGEPLVCGFRLANQRRQRGRGCTHAGERKPSAGIIASCSACRWSHPAQCGPQEVRLSQRKCSAARASTCGGHQHRSGGGCRKLHFGYFRVGRGRMQPDDQRPLRGPIPVPAEQLLPGGASRRPLPERLPPHLRLADAEKFGAAWKQAISSTRITAVLELQSPRRDRKGYC